MDKASSFTVRDIYDFWVAERLLRLPRILFRVDGSASLGMGHVYRSLAVAEELRSISNADIHFLMNAEHPEGIRRVSQSGYAVRALSTGDVERTLDAIREYSPNIVVNDVPYLEESYLESLARVGASTVNLVDSLEDIERPGGAASVIISVMHEDQLELDDYYAGPSFAIVRESFAGRERVPEPVCHRAVVSFGGSDPQGLTLKVLRALDPLEAVPDLTVILGPAFSHRPELEKLLGALDRRPLVLESVENMAETLAEADLVFCAGGMTVYEIAALGTPGIVLSQNAREARRMASFAKYGTIVHLGLGVEVGEGAIGEAARALMADSDRRRAMSQAGRKLVDARGVQRAAEVVLSRDGRGPGAEARRR
jgi:spore coat polysaccharide biosynthesis predicted glycosyltransferase SpsG